MINNAAIEEFKSMTVDELQEFLNAHEQMSFADDSKVRIFCEKHYPEQCKLGFVFGLNAMYVDLSHALYDILQKSSCERYKVFSFVYET